MTAWTPEKMEARLEALPNLPLDERIAALNDVHDELKGFLDAPAAP
jgi:hypothetical protein